MVQVSALDPDRPNAWLKIRGQSAGPLFVSVGKRQESLVRYHLWGQSIRFILPRCNRSRSKALQRLLLLVSFAALAAEAILLAAILDILSIADPAGQLCAAGGRVAVWGAIFFGH